MRNAAADNLWLQASRVLPPGWSTSLTDIDQSSAWSAAADMAAAAGGNTAHTADAAGESTTSSSNAASSPSSSSSDSSMPRMWCVGGMGLQALQLADAVAAAAAAGGAASCPQQGTPGSSEDSDASPPAVAFMPTNQLSAQLFDQVVKVNGMQGCVTVIDRQQAKAWATAAAAAAKSSSMSADSPSPAATQPQQQQLQGLMLPGHCRAQCELFQLLQQLWQLAALLGPATALSPGKVRPQLGVACMPSLQ